jgi:TetR/AcrR family transcriptional repressor of nem operon
MIKKLNKTNTINQSSTRQRLLDVTQQLIWEYSYASVSVDDICARANIGKGSFYHFFSSKADLAAAAFEEHWQSIQPELEIIFSHKNAPADRIKKLAAFVYKKQQEQMKVAGHVCGCAYTAMGSEISGQDEKMRKFFNKLMQKGLYYFEETLIDAAKFGLIESKDIKDKVKEMDAYFIGILTTARVSNSLRPIKKLLSSGLLRIAGFH